MPGRIQRLATGYFPLEEALQLKEARRDEHIFEMRQPAIVQRVDFELEELFLLGGELGDPCCLVEAHGCRIYFWFGRAEEGGYAAIWLRLLCCIGSGVCCLALEAHGDERAIDCCGKWLDGLGAKSCWDEQERVWRRWA